MGAVKNALPVGMYLKSSYGRKRLFGRVLREFFLLYLELQKDYSWIQLIDRIDKLYSSQQLFPSLLCIQRRVSRWAINISNNCK